MITLFCAASDDYVAKYDFCIESHRQWCVKHGYHYELHSGPRELHNWKRWKITKTLDLLRTRDDDVIMIDADCMFADHAEHPHFVDERAHIYYALGKSRRLNSGFVYFRNTKFSQKFLKELLRRLELEIPRDSNFFVTQEGENGHMIWLVSDWMCVDEEKFKIIPRLWNCTSRRLETEANVLHFTNHMADRLEHYRDLRTAS